MLLQRSLLAVALFCAAPTTPLAAQSLTRLLDIEPGADGSNPGSFTDLFDTTVFLTRPRSGVEIWRTDGTPAGTAQVAALPLGSFATMHRLGDHALVIVHGNPATGEVWTTDGTTSGTRLVQSLNWSGRFPGIQASVVAGDKLFFVVKHSFSVRSLWVTDGTPTGTRRLADFDVLDELLVFGNEVAFRARTAAAGYELWRSDGTVTGTRLIRDIDPGPGYSVYQDPIRFRDEIYFVRSDVRNSYELWKSDGTAGGTREWAQFSSLTGNLHIVGAATDYVYVGVHQGLSYYELYSVHRLTGATAFLGANEYMFGGVEFEDRLMFRVNIQGHFGLWFADGAAGTMTQGPRTTLSRGTDETLVAGSRRAFPVFSGNVYVTGSGITTGSMNQNLYLAGGLSIAGGRLYCGAREGNELWEPYVAQLPAHSVQLGTGLGDGLRVPELRTTDPVLGSSLTVSLRDAPPQASVALLVSVATPQPLRFAPDAWSYVDPLQSVVLTGQATAGAWSRTVQIPTDSQLDGQPAVFQAVLLGTPAVRGFELTNAVSTRIGL